MIEPTPRDIGRRVVYRPIGGDPEDGVIVSITKQFVFVRYGINVKATSREFLWFKKGSAE